MSEFLAEARILVRPDTTKFRAELEAALALATAKPITIPVVASVASGVSGAAAATQVAAASQVKLAASASEAATATSALSAAMKNEAVSSQALNAALNGVFIETEKVVVAQQEATAAVTANSAAQARSFNQLARGAGASGLSLFGLRGATLAASGAFLAGTAAVVGFSKAVKSAADLETELNVFRVTAGATADEMERVSAEARQLGKDLTLPGVTAGSAATSMTELAKAGLSVADAMAAARGTLQLSTAAQIDASTSAKLVAGALNSFSLQGKEAARVADLFAGAAKSAQGEITDFGPALGQASAVAHGFGISIEDTITLLTELAKAGLQGGRAGTSLRVALLRLANPTDKAAEALKKLNVQIRDSQGNIRPQIFTDIEEALKGVDKAQRQVTEATIFGSDAVRTQILLGQAGAKGFDDIKRAVTEAGLAQEAAAARTQGLTGDFENLSNQASALGLTIGQVATGPVSLLVKGLATMLGELGTTADGFVDITKKVKDYGSSLLDTIPGMDNFGQHSDSLGDKLGKIAKTSLFILPELFKQLGLGAETSAEKLEFFSGIAGSTTKALNDLAAALDASQAAFKQQQPRDTGLGVLQLQNVIGGFDAKGVRDKIAHDNGQLLSDLQSQQDFLVAQLQRQFVKNRPALKRALEQSLLGVVNDIDSIQNKAAAARLAQQQKADQAAKQALADAEKARQDALAVAAAQERLQNSILDLAIQHAAGTPGIADDKRAFQHAINVKQAQIDALEAIKNKTLEQKQKIVDLKSAVESLLASMKSLKTTSSSSFSLNDLFNEALNNFTTFGSNISSRSGVLSPQDARAQFGESVLVQIGSSQLTEAQKQTLILESINRNTGGGRGVTGTAVLRKNTFQSFGEALQSANNGYGRF